jgi:signal transduction histidine kinase
VEKRAGVEAQLNVDVNIELPADVENSLYRIAQEALNNALKHAEATNISINLRAAEGQVELEIVDNGKGFEEGSEEDKGGMGLGNIRERTEALGGQWSITSKPNEGMRVWIRMPVVKSI